MRQHLMVAPQPPSTYNPKLSPAIDAVILQALAKEPEDRFPSIEEFARAFHQAITYSGDLCTTLTINPTEATTGVERSITLPGGRTVPITIPKNATDGQELRVENQGDPYYEDGPRGSLLLKIAVSPTEAAPASKYVKENVPSTDAVPLEPAMHTSQKPSDQPPSTADVPPPPPLEPKPEPTPAQTTPAPSEKPSNEKWVMPPLPPVSNALRPPSPVSDKRTRKPVITIVSLAAVIILVVSGIIGLAHQASVNAANINATATASTIDANTIATATAKAYAANLAQAVATVNGNATASASDSVNAQATANANPDPYGAGGTLFEIDSLIHDSSYFNSSGNCQVMSDGYHITNSSCDSTPTGATAVTFDNFVFEVKMTINQGDCGGMLLREIYNYYVCSDGSYQFVIQTFASSTVLISGSNSGIVSGQNTIAVVASGSKFTLYLNHKQLNSVSDSNSYGGNIGLIAGSTNNNSTTATEVTYRDVRIWTLD